MSRKSMVVLGQLALAMGIAGASADGAFVKVYSADSQVVAPDPTTAEGGSWTMAGTSPGNVQKGAGTEDGHNYWEVADTNTNVTSGATQNNSVSYQAVGAASDGALGSALRDPGGWVVSFTLKVPASANPTLTPPAYNVPTVVDVRNGRKIYDLAFVNDGVNEGVYHVQTGTTFTADSSSLVASLDLDVYHSFSMVYVPNVSDPTLDVVNVYIDGATSPAFTFADSNSNSSTVYRLVWGSALTAATETVRWESFSFVSPTPTPEPATLGCIACAAGLASLRRVRR